MRPTIPAVLLLAAACSSDPASPSASNPPEPGPTPPNNAAPTPPAAALDATTPDPVPDAGSVTPEEASAPEPSGPEVLGPSLMPEPSDGLPRWLSDTGLYSDIGTLTLADGVQSYQVRAPLWSDTAAKQRYVWLPPDTQIDTIDMDQWVFPVGTKLFKEFTRDGVRVETRLIEKFAEGDWRMVAYHWQADMQDAEAVPDGVRNASDTAHDIPMDLDCTWCHEGRDDRVLGFTALQLSHEQEGINLGTLIADGLLTAPPEQAVFEMPGDQVAQDALWYLHANCGHCHNPTRPFALGCTEALTKPSVQCEGVVDNPPAQRGQLQVFFWQSVRELESVEQGVTYDTLVSKRGDEGWIDAVINRMQSRDGQEMPPVGTEDVDPDGLAAVRTWLDELAAAEFPAGNP